MADGSIENTPLLSAKGYGSGNVGLGFWEGLPRTENREQFGVEMAAAVQGEDIQGFNCR
jgi:hypothetical protein